MKIFFAYMLDKIKDLWTKSKKILATLLAFLAIGGGIVVVNFGGDTTPIDKKDIPINLQLKVDTMDKILKNEETDDYKKNVDGTITNLGKMVVYDYITTLEVSTTTYEIDKKSKVELMDKRTKNSLTYETGKIINGQKEYVTNFYGGSPFWKVDDTYYQVDTATTTVDAFEKQKPPVSLIDKFIARLFIKSAYATDYYVGDGDGNSQISALTGQSWSTRVGQADGNWEDHASAQISAVSYFVSATQRCDMTRMFFPIDTSAIGAGSTVTAASFFIYAVGTLYVQSGGNNNAVITSTNQASTAEVTRYDFDNCGGGANPTEYSADTAYAGWSIVAYTEIPLTTLSIVNVTGTSMIGMREQHDYANVAPNNNANDGFSLYTSKESGTSKDPYLSVTYTAGGGTTAVPNDYTIIFE